MRGEILRYDDQTGAGLISGDDGNRYTFSRGDLQRLIPIKERDRVDFVGMDGSATEVYLVDQPAAQQPIGQLGLPAGPPESSNENLSLWGYFTKCMGKYVEGEGRARRMEYWGFVLFYALILLGLGLVGVLIDVALGNFSGDSPTPIAAAIVFVLSVLVFILPSICVTIRRFHDVGLSGWWYLAGLIPYIGGIFLFVITVLPSQKMVNKHGLYPKPWRG